MRFKNALRKHYIAALPMAGQEAAWLPLARFIETITDDSDESTEEIAYYDGDGTPETEVVSVAEKWSAEGTYDHTDPAHALIASLKRETGEGRKIMHKIEYTNGMIATGQATVTDIKAGGGSAAEYEVFSCTIAFDRIPQVTLEQEKQPKGAKTNGNKD